MHVCMYVCMYIIMYVRTYTRTYVRTPETNPLNYMSALEAPFDVKTSCQYNCAALHPASRLA